MVMPLRDDDTDRRTVPVVTYALIAVNVLVWLLELSLGEKFINGYSTVPFEITHNTDLVGMQTIHAGGQSIPIQLYPGPTPIYLTLLSSMFMHASWLHIGGNMLYLWIFGDNIEDRIGSAKFLVFYLICGLAASAADIMFKPNSMIPSLGASGAIAGVLGAYLVLFPKRTGQGSDGSAGRQHAGVHRARAVDCCFRYSVRSASSAGRREALPTWRTSAGSSPASRSSFLFGGRRSSVSPPAGIR